MTTMSYDIIGDIHGQAGKLEALLSRMGYARTGSRWKPPQGRRALFLGDLIDRGPDQVKVCETVRGLMDAGDALCVMGNHEFNALAFMTEHRERPGQYLRQRSPGKVAQHIEFLRQVGEGSALHRELLAWFRTLPPALDLGGLRAVHAWWHGPYVDQVGAHLAGRPMDDDFLHAAAERGSPLWSAMEGLTKGLELSLPAGSFFIDHSGQQRHEVRTRWWLQGKPSLRDVAIVGDGNQHCVPESPLPPDYPGGVAPEVPVFIGHYWMQGTPQPMSDKVACLDWSAAKHGPLVGYRWDGESSIDPRRFVASH